MKIDFDALQALMEEPVTLEEARQPIVGVYLDPEKDGLPKVRDEKTIKRNIEKIEKGLNFNLNKMAEAT
jgi:hypothetical protein